MNRRAVIEEAILPPFVALLLAVVVGDALILSFGQSPGAVYKLLLVHAAGRVSSAVCAASSLLHEPL